MPLHTIREPRIKVQKIHFLRLPVIIHHVLDFLLHMSPGDKIHRVRNLHRQVSFHESLRKHNWGIADMARFFDLQPHSLLPLSVCLQTLNGGLKEDHSAHDVDPSACGGPCDLLLEWELVPNLKSLRTGHELGFLHENA